MKAVLQTRFGSPDVLEFTDTAAPAIEDDEVLVRVKAASVGAWVWHMLGPDPKMMRLLGAGIFKPKRPVPGEDLAGVVDRVGRKVLDFGPGDEVYGQAPGAFAEFAVAKEGHLALKPKNLNFEEAAAVPIAACTALIGLRDKGKLAPGHQVLIIGAAGGVGTFAVQVAKAMGAHVTGVCSTQSVDLVSSLGADQVIDYTEQDFLIMPNRYDVVLQLAGAHSGLKLREVTKPRGVVVLASGEGGHLLGPVPRLLATLLASPFVSQKLTTFVADVTQEDLIYLTALIESGQVNPVIEHSYPLRDAAEAISHVQAGHAQGKTVIVV